MSGDFLVWDSHQYRPNLIDDLLMDTFTYDSDQGNSTDRVLRLTGSLFLHRYPDTGFARLNPKWNGVKAAEFSHKSLIESKRRAHTDVKI